MKDFDELTLEEKAALTDEEVDRYCKIHAAEEGVPILGPEPEPFTEEPIKPEKVLYEVGGFYFADWAEADNVVELINRCRSLRKTEYVSYASYKKVDAPVNEPVSANKMAVYSQAQISSLKADIEGYHSRKKEADEAQREWRKDREAWNKVTSYITDSVGDARREMGVRSMRQTQFEEYVELAEGDTGKAWAFFTKAGLSGGMGDWRPEGAPA